MDSDNDDDVFDSANDDSEDVSGGEEEEEETKQEAKPAKSNGSKKKKESAATTTSTSATTSVSSVETEEVRPKPSRADSKITIEKLGQGFFLSYAKRVFDVPDSCIVKRGVPLCAPDAQTMTRILNSKSPSVWLSANIQTKHITICKDKKTDVNFLYVSIYVDDENAEFDRKRLHSIPIPVAAAISHHFQSADFSAEKKAKLKPLLEYVSPDSCFGPQINPTAANWQIFSFESSRVPTSEIPAPSQSRDSGKKGSSSASNGKRSKAGAEDDKDKMPQDGLVQDVVFPESTGGGGVKRIRTLKIDDPSKLDLKQTNQFIIVTEYF